MNRFQAKNVLILGATTGIGFATARRLQGEGARVIITGQDAARLERASQELEAIGVRLDLADAASRAAFVQQLRAHVDRLDAVVVNAGIAKFAPFEAIDEEAFDLQFDVNFKGIFFTLQSLLEMLNPGSSIVFNTSINNQVGMPGSTIYGASKAALRSLTRTLAAELLPKKIRVNAVSPGPVETPIFGKLGMPAAQLEAMAAQVVGNVPMGRFGQPEEIAAAIAFLASTESSFIAGEELVVDGGWTAL